jgi:hypothetical protein
VAISACSASTPGTVAGGLMTEYDVSSAQIFNTPGQGRVEFLADGKVVASVIAKAELHAPDMTRVGTARSERV